MKRNTILLLLAAALMTAVSCGKDNEKPEQPIHGGTADGWPAKKISRIVHSVGTFDYLTYDFSWEGDLLREISCTMYDGNPNPMRFPMGMETMGVTNMIFEGVLGNSVLFLGYAFCWSENNMTTLLSSSGQCSYTYDKDGFPTSKTIGTGSQSTIYTFKY